MGKMIRVHIDRETRCACPLPDEIGVKGQRFLGEAV